MSVPSWARWAAGPISAFQSFLGGVRGAALGVWDAISRLWGAVEGAFQRAVEFVNSHIWGPIRRVFDGLWEGAWLIPTAFGHIMHALHGMAFRIAHRIEGAFNAARSLATDLWNEIRGAIWPHIQAVFSRIADLAREIGERVWGAINFLTSRVDDLFRTLTDLVNGFGALVWHHIIDKLYDFVDIIGDIIDRFIDDHWED